MKHLTVLLDGSIQRQFIGLMFGRREDHGTTKHATVNINDVINHGGPLVIGAAQGFVLHSR